MDFWLLCYGIWRFHHRYLLNKKKTGFKFDDETLKHMLIYHHKCFFLIFILLIRSDTKDSSIGWKFSILDVDLSEYCVIVTMLDDFHLFIVYCLQCFCYIYGKVVESFKSKASFWLVAIVLFCSIVILVPLCIFLWHSC